MIGRLYEAFYSTKAEGMGIGLSLCRSIVESHRGRIKAANLYNAGAVAGCRFAFTLPLGIAGRADPAPLPEAGETEPAAFPEARSDLPAARPSHTTATAK